MEGDTPPSTPPKKTSPFLESFGRNEEQPKEGKEMQTQEVDKRQREKRQTHKKGKGMERGM